MRINLQTITTLAIAILLAPALIVHAEAAIHGAESDPAASSSEALAMPIAWQAPKMEPRPEHSVYTPRVELFLGYSYLRGVPNLEPGNRFAWLHGGSTSLALNFNRYFGIVGDFGGFADSELRLKGIGSKDGIVIDSSGTAYTYMVGPRISFRKYDRVTPFIQVLGGGVHASKVTINSDCTDVGCTPLPEENKFAGTAGLGLDLRIRRHVALRLFQAEYLMTRFENRDTGKNEAQNDIRLSGGVVFRFGGYRAAVDRPDLAYSCSVEPSSAFPARPERSA